MGKRFNSKTSSRPLNFDFIAPFYDLGIWFISLFLGGEQGLREEFIREAMPLEGKKTIELFAGTATLSLLAVKYGAKAVATDISAPMLRVAAVKSKKKGIPLCLAISDSASLPFRDCSFQLALISMGLHEVEPVKTKSAIMEASRVLEGGGRLVIEDYYRASGMARVIQRLFFGFTEGKEVRDWLNSDIQGLLRGAGFKDFRRKFIKKGLLQLITAKKT